MRIIAERCFGGNVDFAGAVRFDIDVIIGAGPAAVYPASQRDFFRRPRRSLGSILVDCEVIVLDTLIAPKYSDLVPAKGDYRRDIVASGRSGDGTDRKGKGSTLDIVAAIAVVDHDLAAFDIGDPQGSRGILGYDKGLFLPLGDRNREPRVQGVDLCIRIITVTI